MYFVAWNFLDIYYYFHTEYKFFYILPITLVCEIIEILQSLYNYEEITFNFVLGI